MWTKGLILLVVGISGILLTFVWGISQIIISAKANRKQQLYSDDEN